MPTTLPGRAQAAKPNLQYKKECSLQTLKGAVEVRQRMLHGPSAGAVNRGQATGQCNRQQQQRSIPLPAPEDCRLSDRHLQRWPACAFQYHPPHRPSVSISCTVSKSLQAHNEELAELLAGREMKFMVATEDFGLVWRGMKSKLPTFALCTGAGGWVGGCKSWDVGAEGTVQQARCNGGAPAVRCAAFALSALIVLLCKK